MSGDVKESSRPYLMIVRAGSMHHPNCGTPSDDHMDGIGAGLGVFRQLSCPSMPASRHRRRDGVTRDGTRRASRRGLPPYIVGSLVVSAVLSGSGTGVTADASIASGTDTKGFGFLGFGAAVLATALLGAAFLVVDFTAFLATLDLTIFVFVFVFVFTLGFALVFDFNFALDFTGRLAFLATPFFAAVFLPLATGRFFDLLFFAMINHLLEIVRTRCESSPEKVRCHLRMKLESLSRIQ